MRSENIILQGIKTPCLMAGERSEAGAVFVHGNPGSGGDWKALLTPLSEFVFVAAPDMPGFGDADKLVCISETRHIWCRHKNEFRQRG